ncbi:MAG TPA: MFS transporter [Chitinophagaceae bacterium]|jgi:MFS family permease|nr:MFS transporter [Chitinophagaceae bacterium]
MDSSSARKTLLLLKEKEFAYFISTRFLVIFSLFMQTTVVSYLVYTLTKDPLSLGLIGLAEVIPAFTMALFAGYFVDRREKRSMYLYCIIFYLVNTIFLFIICSNLFIETHSIKTVEWLIYFAMFISGCIRSFLAPSSFSLLPLLINRERMPQAITWSSTSWMLGSVLGPLAGGLLMAAIGVSNTLVIAGFCLALAVYSILKIKPKPVTLLKDIGILKGLREGFSFLFKSQIILAVLSLDLFAVLFGGAEALLPVFSKEILNIGEVGYGWLRSAHGIGAIFLLFILAYLPLKKNIGPKLFLCVGGFGACILLFGLSTNVYLSFGLLFLGGLFDGVSVVIRHSILQLKTPDEIKGRVSSINMMFISSSNELGAFESGLTARLMGTVPAVVFGGIMTILVVITTYFAAPNLRKIKLE